MKKLITLIFLTLLIPALSFAWGVALIGSGIGDIEITCPASTYMFNWTGDAADPDKACFSDGAEQKDGSQTGGTLTANSFVVTSKDQWIDWPNDSADGFNGESGTMWIEVLPDSGNTSTVEIWEAYYDASSNMHMIIESDGDVRMYRVAGGISDNLKSSTTISFGSVHTIGISWQVGRAGADLAISVDKGVTWAESLNSIASMANNPIKITLGNHEITTGIDQTFTFSKYSVLSGWETSCPW